VSCRGADRAIIWSYSSRAWSPGRIAAQWVGWVIEIDRARLPPTAEREYYRADLIGCIVTNEQDVELGVVDHFVEAAGNAVMVVKGEREHWVPAAPRHLQKVDLAAKRLTVDWPAELE
jgi:16S rRNA processing protein RimM